jgi:hypothetical protein
VAIWPSLRACGVALTGSALLATGLTGPAPSAVELAASTPNPVASPNGGVSNVTFYYQGQTPLQPGADLTMLGSSSIVVTTPKSNEADAVAAIHSTGAKAYRYVQFYWAPDDRGYEGINLSEHPGWAFCRKGGSPLVGRTTAGGTRWHFIDANERAVRAQFSQILAGFEADGWDGVMFDRGLSATARAKDAAGRSVWDRKSSCTQDPYRRRATFADAYVNMLGLAHAQGLQAMVNNGNSPFDSPVRMRPDPHNAKCRAHKWAKCRFLDDIWPRVDLVLNETPARPGIKDWGRMFRSNRLSERDSRHGRRTVALITTATLGGARNQTRSKVFYQWSRVKLFDLATAVNTGDGGCGPDGSKSGVCNRYGVHPDLTNVDFGKVKGTKPTSTKCARHDKVRCVWVRRYGRGMNLLNASGRAHTVKVETGLSSCRYVMDVYSGKPLADDECVMSVRLKLRRWTGRPLTYSTEPYVS